VEQGAFLAWGSQALWRMDLRIENGRALSAAALGLAGCAALVLAAHGLATAQRQGGAHPVVQGAGEAFVVRSAELDRGRRDVVIDVAEAGEAADAPPGLEHAARLLNVYALHDVPPGDVQLTLVVHGGATSSVLTDEAHRAHARGANPHDELVERLQRAGVQIEVCGQALRHHGYPAEGVLDGVEVSASAMTSLIDAQRDGAAVLSY